MKKYSLMLVSLFLVSQKLQAQIGINTDSPSATLDIVADKTPQNYAPLSFKNSVNQEILKITNLGNFHFSKALMPANKEGISGEYLISQGPDKPPLWGELQTEYGEILIQEFNAYNSSFSYVESFSGATINFSDIKISPSAEIGSWNSTGKYFRVNKRGLYHITVGLEFTNAYSTYPGVNPEIALIVIGGSFDQAAGNLLYTENNSLSISTYGVLSLILNPGENISAYISTAQGTTGYLGNGYINIQYSSID